MRQRKRKKIDWDAIEADVRAGMSLTLASEKHKVSYPAIQSKSAVGEWQVIKHRVEALARKRAEMKEQEPQVLEVIGEQIDSGKFNPLLFQSTAALIENAANVIYAHRGDIRKAKAVQDKLVDELSFMTTEQAKLTEIIDMATQDVDANNRGVLREKLHNLLSIHARARTYEKLTAAMERMQNMERKAFGIKDDTRPEEPLDRLSDQMLEQKLLSHGIQLRLPKPH